MAAGGLKDINLSDLLPFGHWKRPKAAAPQQREEGCRCSKAEREDTDGGHRCWDVFAQAPGGHLQRQNGPESQTALGRRMRRISEQAVYGAGQKLT